MHSGRCLERQCSVDAIDFRKPVKTFLRQPLLRVARSWRRPGQDHLRQFTFEADPVRTEFRRAKARAGTITAGRGVEWRASSKRHVRIIRLISEPSQNETGRPDV